MSGNYHFYIVNRFDSLIYENDFVRVPSSSNLDKKKEDIPYFYQFIAHASLDFVDEKLLSKATNTFFPNIDHFNEWSVSAYVTPSFLRFIILHDVTKNEDGIKQFCQEVYETYIKFLLNPFYNHNEPIKSEAFDKKMKMAAKRFLGV